MTIGIVGLGLIGGSFAKAYKEADWKVLSYDIDTKSLDFAIISGAVDAKLTKENVGECDLILFCVYPEATFRMMEEFAPNIRKDALVMDCCGTKRKVTEGCFKLAEKYGITYMGGHPMAGTHNSGFKYARSNMYHNAPMVLVPKDFDDLLLLARAEELLAPCGFGKFTVTTAAEHDRMIAFTSQMAHVVSNAYIKSPTARNHKGFSAGSYKDLTRVAWLNPVMWADLFLENKDYLLDEIDCLIEKLGEYREAIENEDRSRLEQILAEGARIKAEVDGR